MHLVEKAVTEALRKAHVSPGEKILVGLSGGADSVALLHVLLALAPEHKLCVYAAHFNHRLRGDESERDEAFVRALCRTLGVPLKVGYASELTPQTPNLEERAREERLEFLELAARDFGADKIALGHTRDDQAETVLMRLLRGAGTKGLKGMSPVGPGKLIRPLLAVGRADVLSYLRSIGANWVEDNSNRSLAYLRNRIRHHLLPLLEQEYAAGLSERLSELAQEMQEVDELIDQLCVQELERRALSDGALSIVAFDALPQALQSALLRNYIERQTGTRRRLTRDHIRLSLALCLGNKPNASIDLPGGFVLRREYDKVSVERRTPLVANAACYEVQLNVPGLTEIKSLGVSFESVLTEFPGAGKPKTLDEAWFDADAVKEAGLTVRNFRPGDRITILGSGGRRKVKELFQEHHVARWRRPIYPVVVMGQDIVWVPGLGRANLAIVGEHTKNLLKVRFFPSIA